LTSKTITWVSDIGEPTDRQVRYINVAFADKDTAYIGKKNIDTAVEVHGLLTEALNKPIEFTLEESGTNKHGGTKWKIKAFGEYQPAPFVPGDSGRVAPRSAARNGSPGPPEHDQFIQERMDRRTALMQAVTLRPSGDEVYVWAEGFYAWLRKTSGSTSSEQQSPLPQAGVDSESTSPAAMRDHATKGEGSRNTLLEDPSLAGDNQSGGVGLGEGPAPSDAMCPPHQLDLDVEAKAERFPCRKCGAWVKPTVSAD
jgi:hypothetical protein